MIEIRRDGGENLKFAAHILHAASGMITRMPRKMQDYIWQNLLLTFSALRV